MLSQHADFTRQLVLAATSYRNNNESELCIFIESFGGRSDQLEALIYSARQCWKNHAHECAPQDILHCLLRLDYSSQPGIMECLKCIRSDIINGRSAIYCISEIQQLLREYKDSPYIDCRERTFLTSLFDICIEPFIKPATIEFSRCSVLLELVPVLFVVLSDGDISSRACSEEEKAMIEKLLSSEWRKGSEVLILNMMTEIERYLKKSDTKRLQVDCSSFFGIFNTPTFTYNFKKLFSRKRSLIFSPQYLMMILRA